MKKSVIFLIGIIYIVSIVVVTFFGMAANIDQFQIYMNKIEITTYTGTDINGKYLDMKMNEEGYASEYIRYTYGPDNATFPDRVKFTLSGNTGINKETGEEITYATISKTGELVVLYNCVFTVTITTTDGSNLRDTMTIYCLS